MSAATLTSAAAGLLACRACHLLNRPAPDGSACARCGAQLHRRKPLSLMRTWTFVVAGYVLYIPANVLPIMQTGSLFGSQYDTIISGVTYLWHTGSWVLAIIIFIASVVVPLGKLAALTLLLISVHRRSGRFLVARTRLYRVLDRVGKWSMVDIYVAAILTALVQFKTVATVVPGPGLFAFGAVVLLTLFASASFDPRLIWDRAPEAARQGGDRAPEAARQGGNRPPETAHQSIDEIAPDPRLPDRHGGQPARP